MNQKNALLSTYLQLHFIVWIWGFTAILGRLITLSSIEIVLYRTLISVMGVYILLRVKGISIDILRKDMLLILATGGIIALHWVTFFLAARISNISICLAGLATTSFWTSLIDPLFNKRKVRFYEPLLGLMSVLGIVVVFNSTMDGYLGLGVAIGSAILSALFTVINGYFIKRQNHYTITFYEMVGAFGACGILLVAYLFYSSENVDFQWSMSMMDLVYLLILGLVCTVYAYSVGVKLMRKLTAFTINLTVNLEPVYGIILAVFLFGSEEKMDTRFYIGTGIIILSVLLYPVIRRYFHDKNIETDIFK